MKGRNMKVLNLFKSTPDPETKGIAARFSEGQESREVDLSDGPVDYDELVREVFRCDKVVCWW